MRAQQPSISWAEIANFSKRYVSLRKRGLFQGIILIDEGRWYISYATIDFWADKKRITFEIFKSLVIEAESKERELSNVQEAVQDTFSSRFDGDLESPCDSNRKPVTRETQKPIDGYFKRKVVGS